MIRQKPTKRRHLSRRRQMRFFKKILWSKSTRTISSTYSGSSATRRRTRRCTRWNGMASREQMPPVSHSRTSWMRPWDASRGLNAVSTTNSTTSWSSVLAPTASGFTSWANTSRPSCQRKSKLSPTGISPYRWKCKLQRRWLRPR